MQREQRRSYFGGRRPGDESQSCIRGGCFRLPCLADQCVTFFPRGRFWASSAKPLRHLGQSLVQRTGLCELATFHGIVPFRLTRRERNRAFSSPVDAKGSAVTAQLTPVGDSDFCSLLNKRNRAAALFKLRHRANCDSHKLVCECRSSRIMRRALPRCVMAGIRPQRSSPPEHCARRWGLRLGDGAPPAWTGAQKEAAQ